MLDFWTIDQMLLFPDIGDGDWLLDRWFDRCVFGRKLAFLYVHKFKWHLFFSKFSIENLIFFTCYVVQNYDIWSNWIDNFVVDWMQVVTVATAMKTKNIVQFQICNLKIEIFISRIFNAKYLYAVKWKYYLPVQTFYCWSLQISSKCADFHSLTRTFELL